MIVELKPPLIGMTKDVAMAKLQELQGEWSDAHIMHVEGNVVKYNDWPDRQDSNFIICGHSKGCMCGRCPFLRAVMT